MKQKISMSVGIKSTLAYILASLFTKGIAFITIPIFTRIMPTEQIGIVNIYNSWFSLIYVFSTLSLTSGGYQVALNRFSEERNKYVSSVTSITSLIAMFFLVVFIIKTDFISTLMGINKSLIFLMILGFFVSPAMDFWLARQRYEYKYKIATVLSVLSAVLSTIFSVLMVIKFNNDALTRLFSSFIVIYGIDACIWVYIMLTGRTYYKREYWEFSLKLGLPMLAYSISTQILNVSDRLMISQFEGERSVGIYGTLYSVSSISMIFWNALNAAYVSYLHKNVIANRDSTRKIASFVLGMYAMCAIILTYLSPELIKIFATEEYYEAIYIMPPIAAGISLMAISNMYSNILLYYQKTFIIVISSVVAASVNVILNAIFIPQWGYKAAAYTTMIAYVFLASLQAIYVVKKRIGMEQSHKQSIYDNKIIFVIGVGGVSACLLGIVLYTVQWIRYLVVLILCIIVTACFYKNGMFKYLLKKEN